MAFTTSQEKIIIYPPGGGHESRRDYSQGNRVLGPGEVTPRREKKQTLCAKNMGMGRATPRGSQASEHWTNLVMSLVHALLLGGRGGLYHIKPPVYLSGVGLSGVCGPICWGSVGGTGYKKHPRGGLLPSGLGLFGVEMCLGCVRPGRVQHADMPVGPVYVYKI